MAIVRARESQRADRLFVDPYAQAFVDAAPGMFPEEPTSRAERGALGPLAELGATFYAHGVIRTRFFDDFLTQAVAHKCSQVVLLAAGLDTRAFRLAWPGRVQLYELDLPQVLTFKDQVLAQAGAVARCDRTTLPADLRANWPAELTKTSFSSARPTAWLIEGLMLYLTASQAERLLLTVSELSPPGSRLSFEHSQMAANDLLSKARTMPAMSEYTALWKGGLGEDAPAWLTRHEWQPQLHELAAVAASYGRDVPGAATGGFLTAIRGGNRDVYRT